MSTNIVTSAAVNSVDAPSGAALNTVNVDFRNVAGAGGRFDFDPTTTQVAAGTFTFPVTISVIDPIAGGATSVINVDHRQTQGSGGFWNLQALTANLKYAGAAAPVAPTTGTTALGSQGARNETFVVTYVDANGNESLPSPSAAQAIGANNVATVTSPGASTGATKWNCYGVITGGTPTLQNASPIALGTGFTEASTGLLTTGRAAPTVNAMQSGAATVTVYQASALAAGAATTITLTQAL